MNDRRDASPLDLWLDEHGDALYAHAVSRVREPALAEDLVQDTLIAAWQAKDDFRGAASVKTWLISILKFKIIDHFRKAERETSLDAIQDNDDLWVGKFDETGLWAVEPLAFRDPASILENTQLSRALLDCIARLPSNLRSVFTLRELEGLDTNELVSQLQISSANNVLVMLSRAREKMRLCLEGTFASGR